METLGSATVILTDKTGTLTEGRFTVHTLDPAPGYTQDSLLELARGKRARKDADLLAGNRVNSGDSGFGAATNSMAVVDRTGHEEIWPNQSKADVAWELCSWLLRM